jgi:hypothetical protein
MAAQLDGPPTLFARDSNELKKSAKGYKKPNVKEACTCTVRRMAVWHTKQQVGLQGSHYQGFLTQISPQVTLFVACVS